MNMSISDRELDTIISAMRLGGDVALYQKLKRIRDDRDDKLSGSYNKNTTEEFGFVL
tara:strand:- start:1893 stop:2063 length:171 start_codon:yes stop_codon:yes gene_type:complete